MARKSPPANRSAGAPANAKIVNSGASGACSMRFEAMKLLAGIALLAGPLLSAAEVDPASSFGFSAYLLVPVRVHLLTDHAQSQIQTTLTPGDISRIFQKLNRVWAQAGLHFWV